MNKKIFAVGSGLLAAVCLTVGVHAFGFDYGGGFSDTTRSYGFLEDEAVVVFNGELITDPEYDELLPGSAIYVPIGLYDENAAKVSLARASAKDMKEDELRATLRTVKGAKYVAGIDTVDGKKEKIKGLDAGIYAKLSLVDSYFRMSAAPIECRLVLSVNKIAHQDTKVEFRGEIKNREQEIDDSSVYGAEVPSKFKVDKTYGGEVTFDFGKDVRYTARVKKGATYYLNLNRTPQADLALMYPKIHMETFHFMGDFDTFASTGTLSIQVPLKEYTAKSSLPRIYVYEVKGDQLVALGSSVAGFAIDPVPKTAGKTKNAAANKNATGTVTIKTKTLGKYILSAEKLNKAIEDTTDNYKNGYADPALVPATQQESSK